MHLTSFPHNATDAFHLIVYVRMQSSLIVQCACVFMHVHVCACMFVCVCICMHVSMYLCLYLCVCTYMGACVWNAQT